MRFQRGAASLLLMAFCFAGHAGAQAPSPLVLSVSPAGDDAWSGNLAEPNANRTDGPVRTLQRAQALAREALRSMAGSAARTAVHVRIAAGNYRLTEPLVFTPADSGAPGLPVVYEAETKGSVVITGGAPLELARVASGANPALFKSPADDRAAMLGGSQLFVNGERATLARYPKNGTFWFVQQPASVAGEPAAERGREAFMPSIEARQWINALSDVDRQSAIVQVMQSWSAGRHRLSDLPAPAGAVRIQPRARWPFLEFGLNQRYFIENVSRDFGAPGEWIWDAAGVRYMPLPTQNRGPLLAVMPMIETLIVIKGDSKSSTWVHDLQFLGLKFHHTRLLTPKIGDFDNQAGAAVGAAIMVDAARRIEFVACDIAQLGGYALWLRESVRDSNVTGNTMRDLGGGGIKVGLQAQLPSDPTATGANTISGNTVRDTGKVIPGAVGIWIGQSFDNTVSNNLIANTSYSGISVGWKWGQGPATSGRNKIDKNLLVNIGNGQLSDLGAIYTLGESPGTAITGNVIREVRAYTGYGAGAWGIYNDEGSSNLRVENNVVIGTTSGGYHLHYGRDNVVNANLFAMGDLTEVRLPSNGSGEMRLQFSNNILLPNADTVFTAPVPALSANVTFVDNVVASAKGSARANLAAAPAASALCSIGCSAGNASITLAPDLRKSSLVSSEKGKIAWFASALASAGPPGLPTAQLPVAQKPSSSQLALPLSPTIDIANTSLGTQPLGMQSKDGNAGGKISVESAPGSPNGRCLRFSDAPNPARPWEPFAYANLNHTSGRTRVRFTLMVDQRSDFIHEWRDSAKPYRSGPSLRITADGVRAGGKTIAKVVPGQWIDVTVEANLGDTNHRWRVDVASAAGNGHAESLPPATAGWASLDWLGFISAADVDSTACIGLIEVTHLQGH